MTTESLNEWYDWLVSHTPEPIKRAPTAISKKVAKLYAEISPKESLRKWFDWLVDHTLKPIRRKTVAAFETFKDTVRSLYDRELRATKITSSLKNFVENHVVDAPRRA